jgi:hypothetical protein
MWSLRGPQHRATAFVFPCGDEDSAAAEQREQCLRDLLKRRRQVVVDVDAPQHLDNQFSVGAMPVASRIDSRRDLNCGT